MTFERGLQILKTRDDPESVYLRPDADSSEAHRTFRLTEDSECSWAKDNKPFGPETIRPRIEPWLTALVQSEHLSLLIGSGLTHATHYVARGETLPAMEASDFEIFNSEISAEMKRVAAAAERGCGNFEDQIRVANELLRGLEILSTGESLGSIYEAQVLPLRNALTKRLGDLADLILEGERNLVSALPEKRKKAFKYLVSFLMSFASRSGTRERLHIFTTNYDRYIEAGSDVAGLHLIDRFIGTLVPVFRSSRLDIDLHYNPPGIRGEPRYMEGVARFTKLHGSVDWVDRDGQIQRIGLPLGARNAERYLTVSDLEDADTLGDTPGLMIYPNAAKDRETASYPYVELFRDFAAAICRPNSTLVCYGYSFGDDHINRVIEDMLTIPSAHLVIISYDDRLGRIMKMLAESGRDAQITLLIGDHLADLRTLVRHYLPKPAIDFASIRMAELLRTRWSIRREEDGTDEDDKANGEDVEQ